MRSSVRRTSIRQAFSYIWQAQPGLPDLLHYNVGDWVGVTVSTASQ